MSTDNTENTGVILQAKNGDVIGYDETGLTLNLSDIVIKNIRGRLTPNTPIDPAVLGNIDAWDLTTDNEWFIFSARLNGMQGIRKFQRKITSHDDEDIAPSIIASTGGNLLALLSIGGSRRATTANEIQDFPYHIVTAQDDIGATGVAGMKTAKGTPYLQTLTEQTQDSLLAQGLIATKFKNKHMLPLIFVRAETDSSASIAQLITGKAYRNFIQALDNAIQAGTTLNKKVSVLNVGLDFTLDDVLSSPVEWQAGMHLLMQNITNDFAKRRIRKPLFSAIFDSGTKTISDTPILRSQWDLAWNTGNHDFIYIAAGYMFPQDDYARPTKNARIQISEMSECAISACNQDQEWACPVFLLAEREIDSPHIIRCRSRAMDTLIIDKNDPLNAGEFCGFILQGAENNAKIIQIEIAKDDPQDLLITCDKAPEGKSLTLCYAIGHHPSNDDFPANRGSIRDAWEYKSKTEITLHRWALPATLPIH